MIPLSTNGTCHEVLQRHLGEKLDEYINFSSVYLVKYEITQAFKKFKQFHYVRLETH